ncbi:LuxR C-terminal-related transcriptional regulator [Pseudonocardia spirodelae]|uniref:histidine kinase n=1 Tax=Pseudonocardia spirodelae TaxID=3133431 RepID=A0ABU8T0A5_9PSEU
MILSHGAVQDRGVTTLLDDLVRRTSRRLGGAGGAVALLRAPGAGDGVATTVVHHDPLPSVGPVLSRLVREQRTVVVPGPPGLIGAPLWWDDELLGACVFGGDPFAVADTTEVEGFAGRAAVAVVAARLLADAVPAAPDLVTVLRTELDRALHALGARGGVVTMGADRVPDPAVGEAVLVVARALLDNAVRHSAAGTLRLGLVFEPGAVRLIVEDDGRGFDPVRGAGAGLARAAAAVRAAGGQLDVDSTPGWGTRVRACFPDPPAPCASFSPGARVAAPATGSRCVLTQREREVRELVEQGLADKQIAFRLAISVKTVEKHVGAVLRKTGARNRTMLARFGAGS